LLQGSPSKSEQAAILASLRWIETARPNQIAPEGPKGTKEGDWSIWFINAGRSFGKTLAGANWLAGQALTRPETIGAVVAPTSSDLRRVCFEGPSGIIQAIPQVCLWKGRLDKAYNRQTSELVLWNGSKLMGFSAIEPDRMRGPQYHYAWGDEVAAWRYDDAYDQLTLGLRLGKHPRLSLTSTPRPTKLIRAIINDPKTYVVRGSTFENVALSQTVLDKWRERYEGTRLGRQELYAEILDDVEGALWTHNLIDRERRKAENLPDMRRIVIGIDPAVTSGKDSDETGIIVAGLGEDNRYYVLEDESGRYKPDEWANLVIKLYQQHQADRIVAEVNNGGDLVERMLRIVDKSVSYRPVRASKGKITRAEPIASLYEQSKVSHVGSFALLEDQMCTYIGGGDSPDRLDALVWALTDLSTSTGAVGWRIS
jgi:predicted phage terminase large subunit-like protein